MKKRFMFSLGLVLVTSCLSLSACSDDDDDPKKTTCTCTERDPDDPSYSETREIDPATFGESNCADLADKFNYMGTGTIISCH